jgi:hypothetical protein
MQTNMQMDRKMPRALSLKTARTVVIGLAVTTSFIVTDQRGGAAEEITLVCVGKVTAPNGPKLPPSVWSQTLTWIVDLDRSEMRLAEWNEGRRAKITDQTMSFCDQSKFVRRCLKINRITGTATYTNPHIE